MLIAWKGKIGIASLILIAVATQIAIHYHETDFAYGLKKVPLFLITSAILTLPLAIWDMLDFFKTRKINQTTFFIPVFCLPLVSLILFFLLNK